MQYTDTNTLLQANKNAKTKEEQICERGVFYFATLPTGVITSVIFRFDLGFWCGAVSEERQFYLYITYTDIPFVSVDGRK